MYFLNWFIYLWCLIWLHSQWRMSQSFICFLCCPSTMFMLYARAALCVILQRLLWYPMNEPWFPSDWAKCAHIMETQPKLREGKIQLIHHKDWLLLTSSDTAYKILYNCFSLCSFKQKQKLQKFIIIFLPRIIHCIWWGSYEIRHWGIPHFPHHII